MSKNLSLVGIHTDDLLTSCIIYKHVISWNIKFWEILCQPLNCSPAVLQLKVIYLFLIGESCIFVYSKSAPLFIIDLQKSQSTKLSGLLSAGELVSKSNSLIREFLLTNASAGLKSTRTQFLCSGTTSRYFSGCNPP
jgi:hypothetical protein